MAHSKETPKIYFHVYRAKSSPHNQNWYAHRFIVSYGKYSFLNVFMILWKIEVESPIFFHDKYDLNYVSSHLNIYKATFLFDSWALWPPEIWHSIFMTNQVSQYVLWDHKTHFSRQLNCWSLRCSWSIACRRCSNYFFILHLIPGFNLLHKGNCNPRRETCEFWDLVWLILEIIRYIWELVWDLVITLPRHSQCYFCLGLNVS